MKNLYGYFCKLEETLVKSFLVAITFLVFISAIFRTMKYPLNWAVDLSMLLFAWVVFLGANMALRNTELVNVDLFINKFSAKIRKNIYIFWNIIIILFLFFLIWHGIPLALESTNRQFQTLGISYSWATISVPVGALLMIISTCIKIFKALKKENW
ncbi:C4-dicarboxylate transporter DctQ subunit [Neobacillus niacini]|uniref:TRAP transporter small permease n=1 Tax=Neobacillus niacini TaxID=86668 RepID=UPI0027831532|nr:TRAP transporter small permease subunit [Neobacillus niacini]MDQ1004538.1 C4-dicarboxylate transporter DctQ subunit [Neobacillus niacini]